MSAPLFGIMLNELYCIHMVYFLENNRLRKGK